MNIDKKYVKNIEIIIDIIIPSDRDSTKVNTNKKSNKIRNVKKI